jgi:hypothetical protein
LLYPLLYCAEAVIVESNTPKNSILIVFIVL